MPAAVREALIRVLQDAVHAQRSLFGRTCHDVPSFFVAADRSDTGHLSRSELHDAFSRLDVGLTAVQLGRLMATLDADRDGKVSLAELSRWMSSGSDAPVAPAGPWTPVAAVTGAPVVAQRTDHLPIAQLITDSSGWKEVLGGTAVARGRARGNAALGRASRNGEVPLDGQSSPWHYQRSANGAGEASDNGASTPPRVPRSPSVTSTPDSLFAATAGMPNAGQNSPAVAARAPVREAWDDNQGLETKFQHATDVGEENNGGSELSESDLEEAARLYEATNGRAAATGTADPPMSARDGWELCCSADGQEYWFNFQTGERREQATVNDASHADSTDEPVEEPRRYDAFSDRASPSKSKP